jgi:hypothetical protein
MNTNELLLPLAAFGIAFLLRLSRRTRPYLWILNLFAVLIHELCHGLAALLTGGKFERFHMESHGGVAYTRGGQRAIIIPAGYVGTAIFGAILLYVTNVVEQPGWVAVGLGIGFLILTILFSGMSIRKLNIIELVVIVVGGVGVVALFLAARENDGLRWAVTVGAGLLILLFVRFISDEYFFTVAIGALTSGVLLLLGFYSYEGQPEIARFVLNFLAFMVGLNAIFDSWYLFQLISDPSLSQHGNDATNMSKVVPLPAQLWATIWALNSVVMLGIAVGLVVARR